MTPMSLAQRQAFGAILVMGALMRLWGLGDESLWHDEAFSWAIYRDTLAELFDRLAHSEAHPPLFYLLGWGWAKLGAGEAMLRLPAALLGIASLPVVFRIARVVGGARAGLIAMALLAFSPFHIKYSMEARSYALLFFLCAISLDILLALRANPTAHLTAALFSTVNALIVYTAYLGIFFFLGEAVLVAAWAREDRRILRPVLLAGLGSVVLFLPWLPFAIHHVVFVTGDFWMPRATPTLARLETEKLLLGTGPIEPLWRLPVALLALAAWGARRRDLRPWVLCAIVPFAAEFAAGVSIKIFCARGLIFVLIPLAVLAGVALASAPALLRAVIAGVLVAALLPGLLYVHAGQEKEDWRSAASFLRREARTDDLVVVHEGFLEVSLRYYWRDWDAAPEIVGVTWGASVDPGVERGSLVPCVSPATAAASARGHQQVWLVRRTYAEMPEMPKLLSAFLPATQDRGWRYVRVTRYRPSR